MAVVISPTTPGPITDPRRRATEQYLEAVQKDLDKQTKEWGMNIDANRRMYNERWKPLPADLFVNGQPNPGLKGFSPNRDFKFTGVIGTLGGVRQIGST
jgi:hypothetical protein